MDGVAETVVSMSNSSAWARYGLGPVLVQRAAIACLAASARSKHG